MRRILIKYPRHPAPERWLRGIEIFAVKFAEVDLQQQADAVGTASVRADGVDAVAVIHQNFPTVGG